MIDLKKVSLMISSIFELGLAIYVAKELLEYDAEERARKKNEELLERQFREEMEKIYEENV